MDCARLSYELFLQFVFYNKHIFGIILILRTVPTYHLENNGLGKMPWNSCDPNGDGKR